MDCSVQLANSGRQAIQKLQTQEFDLIISDIRMPDMNGLDLYDWIKASFDNKHIRTDGAIHTVSPDLKLDHTMEFTNALVTAVGFPALDAASKDAAKMTIKFAPEFTRSKKGSQTTFANAATLGKGEQKIWMPANLNPTVGEGPCGRPSFDLVRRELRLELF